MSFYKHHLFFCTNLREDGTCCNEHFATEIRAHAKQRIKALGLNGQGKIRVNAAGCLDRCSEGPIAVVYPEGVWYTYESTEDIDEIIDKHLVKGRVVERLQI